MRNTADADDQRLRLTFLKTRSRLTMRTAWSEQDQRRSSQSADAHKIMPTKVSATRAPWRSHSLSVLVPSMFESPMEPRHLALGVNAVQTCDR